MLRDIAWVAVLAATCLFLGLLLGCFGVGAHDWYVLALGALFEAAGIGLSLLSWREDR